MRLLAIVLLVTSCSWAPPAKDACNDHATAICNKVLECSNGTAFPRQYTDYDTCITRQALTCTLGLQARGTLRTTKQLELCAEAVAQVSCTDLVTGNYGSACVQSGNLVTGDSCAFNDDCQSGFCANTRVSKCGTCAPLPTAGDSCTTSNCAPGQECYLGTCQVPAVAGGACVSELSPCASDYYCTTQNECAASLQVGAGCSTGHCDPQHGLICSGVTDVKTCEVEEAAQDGEPCGELASGVSVTCANGACYDATGLVTSTAGTCKANAADGAACDTVLGPACLTPARCNVTSGTAGTCVLPQGC